MKVFVHDIALCNGCYSCQTACKDEHLSYDRSPYAKPQPETGHFWLKLVEKSRGQIPRLKLIYTPHLCNHCDNSYCIKSCPVRAIYKRTDGLVIVNPAKCIGCTHCISACPYQSIFFNARLNIAQKCTGCAHLLDNGWDNPRCVDACPTQALKFMEETQAQELIGKAEVLHPEYKTKPRIYYLNISKRLMASTILRSGCQTGSV